MTKMKVVVKYDLCPYAVVHDAIELLDNGDVKSTAGVFKKSSVLAIVNAERGDLIDNAVTEIRASIRTETKRMNDAGRKQMEELLGRKLK